MTAGAIAGPRLGHHLAGKARADDALEFATLAGRDRALGMHGRQPRGDAGAGRRAVDLGVGEDADIAARPAARAVMAVGEDRAVEEGEIGMVGMGKLNLTLDLVRQRGCGVDEVACPVTPNSSPNCAGLGQRVEGAAIGDVEGDLAIAGHVQHAIAGEQEGGHAVEGNRAGLAVLRPRRGRPPCRRGIRC